jgi:hypothetical protein
MDGSMRKPLLSSSTTPMPLGLAVRIQSDTNQTLVSGTADATTPVVARILGMQPAAFVGACAHIAFTWRVTANAGGGLLLAMVSAHDDV